MEYSEHRIKFLSALQMHCMTRMTLTYKMKDFVKAIKFSVHNSVRGIKWVVSFCLGEKKKKMNFAL